MPWFGGWGGRGHRWWYRLTGLPGWIRFGYSGVYPWFWQCRWFPWLPRWWWTGMYGPVTWTPRGPVLAQNATGVIPQVSSRGFPIVQPTSEIEYLKQQKQMLEEQLKGIEKRIKELEEMLK